VKKEGSVMRKYETVGRTFPSMQTICDRVEHLALDHPVSIRTAYSVMGLMLGTFPPAAIFWKLFGYGIDSPSPLIQRNGYLAAVFFAMNVVCAGFGYFVAYQVVPWFTRPKLQHETLLCEEVPVEYLPWRTFLVLLPMIGAFWGICTGAAGGVIFFGIGAMVAPAFAMPVGFAGFTAFGLAHRWLHREGMIEAYQFLPLAVGITMVITAGILGIPFAGVR
jgi:hypothetical protein